MMGVEGLRGPGWVGVAGVEPSTLAGPSKIGVRSEAPVGHSQVFSLSLSPKLFLPTD